jgi:hypothetical protein
MSSEKVLLDLPEAEKIFHQLSMMHAALRAAGTTIEERKELVRAMVKIKVAINRAKGIRASE